MTSSVAVGTPVGGTGVGIMPGTEAPAEYRYLYLQEISQMVSCLCGISKKEKFTNTISSHLQDVCIWRYR